MKKKKSLLVSLLMLVMCIFCGCSQTNYIVVQNPNGTVEQVFSIELNSEKLMQAGISNPLDIEALKNELYTDFEKVYTSNMAKFKLAVRTDTSLSQEIKLKYENGVKAYLGWDKNNENLLALILTFNNASLYNYYKQFQIAKDTFTKEDSENIFVRKTKKTITTIFGQEFKNGKTTVQYFKEKYKDYIISKFSQEVYDKLPKLTFSYTYITPSSRLHTNADESLVTNIGRMHVWNFTEEDENFDIEIYYLSAKPLVWYIIALTITFMFVAIYLIIIYFKKDKPRIYINKDLK